MAEENVLKITSLDAYQAKSILYTSKFEDSLESFRDLLGVTDVIKVSEGDKIELQNAPIVELADGKVPEGELIPLSKVTPVKAGEKVITMHKHRKAVTAEAVRRYTKDKAVNKTDEAIVKELQKNLRTELFDAFQAGQEVSNEEGGVQGALAESRAAIKTVFEDDVAEVIVLAHPQDIKKYVAQKNVTVDTQFGLTYLTTATGVKVIETSLVKEGHVYATAAENLVLAYIPINEALAEFGMTTDDTGFIGMSHQNVLNNLTTETVYASGVHIFPERIDGVIKVSTAALEDPEPAGE